MFEHCLYFNTTSLARRLEREWSAAFKPFGLTPAQAFMLRVILAQAPIAYTALAGQLNISKATCSRTVDGLLQMELIERSQTDADGRSFELQPTGAGKALLDSLNDASAAVTRKLKGIVGAAEFAATVSTLRGISAAIE